MINIYTALNDKGVRIDISDATSIENYYCPICNESLIVKKGEIKAHHFAHKNITECDSWYEMSEWHKTWQNRFNIENREVVLENHRADIKINNLIIEFQKSPLSINDMKERVDFYKKYGKLVFMFDLRDKDIYKETTHYHHYYTSNTKKIGYFEELFLYYDKEVSRLGNEFNLKYHSNILNFTTRGLPNYHKNIYNIEEDKSNLDVYLSDESSIKLSNIPKGLYLEYKYKYCSKSILNPTEHNYELFFQIGDEEILWVREPINIDNKLDWSNFRVNLKLNTSKFIELIKIMSSNSNAEDYKYIAELYPSIEDCRKYILKDLDTALKKYLEDKNEKERVLNYIYSIINKNLRGELKIDYVIDTIYDYYYTRYNYPEIKEVLYTLIKEYIPTINDIPTINYVERKFNKEIKHILNYCILNTDSIKNIKIKDKIYVENTDKIIFILGDEEHSIECIADKKSLDDESYKKNDLVNIRVSFKIHRDNVCIYLRNIIKLVPLKNNNTKNKSSIASFEQLSFLNI